MPGWRSATWSKQATLTETLSHDGPPDPLIGDHYHAEVRRLAKLTLDSLAEVPGDAPRSENAAMGYRIVGFGSGVQPANVPLYTRRANESSGMVEASRICGEGTPPPPSLASQVLSATVATAGAMYRLGSWMFTRTQPSSIRATAAASGGGVAAPAGDRRAYRRNLPSPQHEHLVVDTFMKSAEDASYPIIESIENDLLSVPNSMKLAIEYLRVRYLDPALLDARMHVRALSFLECLLLRRCRPALIAALDADVLGACAKLIDSTSAYAVEHKARRTMALMRAFDIDAEWTALTKGPASAP